MHHTIHNDQFDPFSQSYLLQKQFAYDLLAAERVLIVQGTGFNCSTTDHFRVVFLPNTDDLTEAIGRISHFLDGYRRLHARA